MENVAVIPARTRQVAVTLIAWLGPEEDILSRCSPVHDGLREAVVRAVLDAVNRPVVWLSVH